MHSSFKYEVDVEQLTVQVGTNKPKDVNMGSDSDLDNSDSETEIEDDGTLTWAQYISNGAFLKCPHAKNETLTQYEIDLGLGTPVTVESMSELLKAEFKWFDKIKKRNSGGQALTADDFASFGFSLVLSIMKSVFSQNPILLAELLKLPMRATFTNADTLAALFLYREKSLIDGDKMAKLLRMLRTDLNGSMPMESYRALLAMQRIEKVRARDPYAERRSRGHRVGLAAFHEALPLMGKEPGVAAPGVLGRGAPARKKMRTNPKRTNTNTSTGGALSSFTSFFTPAPAAPAPDTPAPDTPAPDTPAPASISDYDSSNASESDGGDAQVRDVDDEDATIPDYNLSFNSELDEDSAVSRTKGDTIVDPSGFTYNQLRNMLDPKNIERKFKGFSKKVVVNQYYALLNEDDKEQFDLLKENIFFNKRKPIVAKTALARELNITLKKEGLDEITIAPRVKRRLNPKDPKE